MTANLAPHRDRGAKQNQTRAAAKIEALTDALEQHPELIHLTLENATHWLNDHDLLNQRSMHEVPVTWTKSSLRKPWAKAKELLASRRQVQDALVACQSTPHAVRTQDSYTETEALQEAVEAAPDAPEPEEPQDE